MNSLMLEKMVVIKGIDPVADAFADTVYTDIVSYRDFRRIVFIVHKGVGTTGTSTITVEACDDVSGSNVTPVVFDYRRCSSTETHGTLTRATTSGFATTAGSSETYAIEVDSEILKATGYGFVRLKLDEVADDAVLGGVLILGFDPRYSGHAAPVAVTA